MEEEDGYLRSLDVQNMLPPPSAKNHLPKTVPCYINIHKPEEKPRNVPPTPPYKAKLGVGGQLTEEKLRNVPPTPPYKAKLGVGGQLTPSRTSSVASLPRYNPKVEDWSNRANSSVSSTHTSLQDADTSAPPSPQSLRNLRSPPFLPDSLLSPTSPRHDDVPLPTSRSMTDMILHGREPQTRRERRNRSLKPGEMQYGVEDVPPWYLCILLGFQHYLIMFGATVANPLVVAKELCIGDTPEDRVAKSELIGTIFFVSGIATVLQTTLGIRLPIIQGGTFTFVTPIVALMSLPQWKCPDTSQIDTAMTTVTPDMAVTRLARSVNQSLGTSGEEVWQSRMREVQGAIMVASLFQVLIGFTGVIGCVLRFIGPLSIAPTIALVGLALFQVAADFAAKQWWITLVTVVLIVAFSQYSKNVAVPCFYFKRNEGCTRDNVPIFRLFPVILAVGITWAICAILTATNVFPSDPDEWGYGAQTNINLDVLDNSPWFRIPYPVIKSLPQVCLQNTGLYLPCASHIPFGRWPHGIWLAQGQWGLPTVSAAAVFGMLSGVIASMVETLGDYYACARLSGAPPPPMHAINRGIGMEGIGCIIAGAWGHGSGTTSYSENIGAIGITRVASRRVSQFGGLIMIIFGVFGKFGALFVTIPDPIVGGVFIVMFGMITAVGISNLQFVDLNSSRNLFIIGFSFFFGLTLPSYLKANPGAIAVGVAELDQILTVLLSTSMFVGGLAGFILDNSIPGTDEERGLTKWRMQSVHQSKNKKKSHDNNIANEVLEQAAVRECYEIAFLTRILEKWQWTRYIPFFPTFDENLLKCKRRKRKKRRKREEEVEEGEENEEDTV